MTDADDFKNLTAADAQRETLDHLLYIRHVLDEMCQDMRESKACLDRAVSLSAKIAGKAKNP